MQKPRSGKQVDLRRSVIVNLQAGIDVSPKVIDDVFSRRKRMSETEKAEFDGAILVCLRGGGEVPSRVISDLIRRSSKLSPEDQVLLAQQTVDPTVSPGERDEIIAVLLDPKAQMAS